MGSVLLAILILIEIGYTTVFRHHFSGVFTQQVDRDTVEIIEGRVRKPDAIVEAAVDPTQLARVAHSAWGSVHAGRSAGWADAMCPPDVLAGSSRCGLQPVGPRLDSLDVYIHWDAEALMNRLMEPGKRSGPSTFASFGEKNWEALSDGKVLSTLLNAEIAP